MKGGNFLKTALIVSYSESGIDAITKILQSVSCKKITLVKTCGEARRLALNTNFDLFIINSPVHNESGEDLAKELVTNSISQVIFLVKNDKYDYMSSKVEDFGVITVSKPINKNALWSSIKLSKAMNARMLNMQKINIKLTKKIEDIRIVDRAKCLLISYLNMSETEAHKYIEKQAMDTRASRREIAEKILKTYEN